MNLEEFYLNYNHYLWSTLILIIIFLFSFSLLEENTEIYFNKVKTQLICNNANKLFIFLPTIASTAVIIIIYNIFE